jgi:hypothetical protein
VAERGCPDLPKAAALARRGDGRAHNASPTVHGEQRLVRCCLHPDVATPRMPQAADAVVAHDDACDPSVGAWMSECAWIGRRAAVGPNVDLPVRR